MNEQTKKLKQQLGELYTKVGVTELRTEKITLSPVMIDKLLQVCKEAGLKFVPESWILPKECITPQTNPPLYKGMMTTINAFTSQIKEIEIE